MLKAEEAAADRVLEGHDAGEEVVALGVRQLGG